MRYFPHHHNSQEYSEQCVRTKISKTPRCSICERPDASVGVGDSVATIPRPNAVARPVRRRREVPGQRELAALVTVDHAAGLDFKLSLANLIPTSTSLLFLFIFAEKSRYETRKNSMRPSCGADIMETKFLKTAEN